MSNRPYMPLYVGDYLADTGHLTTLEHGAYLLLIMHYWRIGFLPTDDRRLANICRLSMRQWPSVKIAVSGFFDENWAHKRVAEELQKVTSKTELRSEIGGKGGRAKALNYKKVELAKAKQLLNLPLANAYQSESESETEEKKEKDSLRESKKTEKPKSPRQPKAQKSKITADAQPLEVDLEFARSENVDSRREWPKFRDYHLQKASEMADWAAAWRTWCRNSHGFARAGPSAPAVRRNPHVLAFEASERNEQSR